MKLPPVRFTVRRLMIAVAVFAALVAWVGRLLRLSGEYQQRAVAYERTIPLYISSGHGRLPAPSEHDLWARGMADKYWRAARLPWLPVGPDPPEPKFHWPGAASGTSHDWD